MKTFTTQLWENLSAALLYRYGRNWKDTVNEHELLQNLIFELHLDDNYQKRIIDSSILIAEYPHLKKTYEEQL